jgi:T-complex protein 11
LLFDAGLQFRPTAGRRKRELAEKYWLAVTQELKTECTCVSFDMHGEPHTLVCACKRVALPVKTPMLAFSSSHRVLTLRTPSRIRPLLTEFLEVLLSVIQPLASISGMCVNPDTLQVQMREHAAQAAHLRSVFDTDLIEQEMRYGLFDPSGLFRSIGDTLKSHCAPMRDRAVESMVAVAASCAPGGSGGNSEAVNAIRMCMDILELMKLVSITPPSRIRIFHLRCLLF